MKRIQSGFEEFERMTVSKEASLEQRKDIAYAFFAGAYRVLWIFNDIAEREVGKQLSTDAGAAILRELYQECNVFFEMLKDDA
jgi:hypothetical protein